MSDPKNDASKTDTTKTGATVPERQPDSLANFAATARSADGVSPTGGRRATPETEAIPTDPQLKADAATKVLREGVLGRDEGADEAIDRLPDRTRSTDG